MDLKMDKDTCIICNGKLIKTRGDGGLSRRSVESVLKCKNSKIKIPLTESFEKNFGVKVTPNKNVCYNCFCKVSNIETITKKLEETKETLQNEKKTVYQSSYIKRKAVFTPSPVSKKVKFSPITLHGPWTSTPSVPFKRTSAPTSTIQRITFKSRVIDNIKQGNYDTAFRLLYSSSSAARKDIHKVIGHLAYKEMTMFARKLTTYRQELSLETISKFSWTTALKEFDDGMPLLSSVLRGCLTTAKSKDKISCDGKKTGPLVPTFGLLMGVLLGKRHPGFKFLQQIVSIQMFRSGCNHKLFKWFKKFGVCMSVSATRSLVDKLGKQYDQAVCEWKQTIEEIVLGVKPTPVQERLDYDNDESSVSEASFSDGYDDTDDGDDYDDELDISTRLEDTFLWSDDDLVPLPDQSTIEPENIPGYSLCWDNVQKLATARYESTHRSNKMLLWANCFATKDRIPFSNVPCDWLSTTIAGHIDLTVFLPSDDDWEFVRARMEVLVQRMLVNLYDIDVEITEHIEHQYSDLSSAESEIVNLGIVKENPSTCKGVIEIMKFLQRYVPMGNNGEVWPLICHGDQLSIERMIEAKLAMSSCSNPTNRLQGLIPRPQNFHKRVILYQDTLDLLYGKGASDKGTLTQIKNKFGHRNVKKKASECVNHLSDFLNFVTEGHLCLLSTKLLQTDSPKDHLTTSEDIQRLAKAVVCFIWPAVAEYESAMDEDTKYTCICHSDGDVGDSEWIECSSQRFCETRWFHKECMSVQDGDEEEDWWCSEDCKRKGKSGYCCRKQKEDDWIECGSGQKCTRNQWFHKKCVGYTEGEWFCSELCHLGHDTDHKQAYAMSILWRGMLHMLERDTERENDGDGMMTMWRINMIEFWEFGHYKYLILAHRLLASINGWMPERIKLDLIWNSTANLRGEQGCNLPLDLINEFLNNEFKANLKRLRGQYTDAAVQRCSLIAGTVGKGLEEMFMTEVIDKYLAKSGSAKAQHKRDISKFVHEYSGEKLFDNVPGRYHVNYDRFQHCIQIKNVKKMKERLRKYATNLDLQRLLVH